MVECLRKCIEVSLIIRSDDSFRGIKLSDKGTSITNSVHHSMSTHRLQHSQ